MFWILGIYAAIVIAAWVNPSNWQGTMPGIQGMFITALATAALIGGLVIHFWLKALGH